MKTDQRKTRDLVLIGGGHANIQVIKKFAMNPIRDLRITLISKVNFAPYSGMLPGHLAGWYSFEESHFDLRSICEQAGFRFIKAEVSGINSQKKTIEMISRPPMDYDLLSINVGIEPTPLQPKDENIHLLSLKPMDQLLNSWKTVINELESKNQQQPALLSVVGAGAAGMEMSIILAQILQNKKIPHEISLVSKDNSPLSKQSRSAQRWAKKALSRYNIKLIKQQSALSFDGRTLKLSKDNINADYVFCATQAQAPKWFKNTDLSLSPSGFLQVDDDLLVQNQKSIFSAGDCCQFSNYTLPKAGIYAVRQGAVLTENIYRHLLGKNLKIYKPQKRTLFLVTTGDKRALASYGPWVFESSRMWSLKNYIDQKFMTRFKTIPKMNGKNGSTNLEKKESINTCGGCGSKVEAASLHRVLGRLKATNKYLFSQDLGKEDCSIHPAVHQTKILHNLDAFRAFIDDPYILGRIIGEHALNDIYAMGGKPTSAQALVTLASASPALLERELWQTLSGVAESLSMADTELSGGHTMEGREMTVGLSVLGNVTTPIAKNNLQPGHSLVLTKPIGSGALLAANMLGHAQGDHIEALLDSMILNHQKALEIFQDHLVSSLTDITGFGLAGHLLEMLKSTMCSAELKINSVPIFEGAQQALESGHKGVLSESLKINTLSQIHSSQAIPDILFDPQTSGGLLACVPTNQAQACVDKLRAIGYTEASIIGNTVPSSKAPILLISSS